MKMNRREYHKIQTAWEKCRKKCDRAIDRVVSICHLSRADAERLVLSLVYDEKVAPLKSYRQRKKEHLKVKTAVQHWDEIPGGETE